MYEVLVIQGEEPPKAISNVFAGNDTVNPHRVSSGAEAMDALQNDTKYQLIFANSKLPAGVDGLQLMLKARALSPGSRVLIAKDDDFQHVTERIGIARFIPRSDTQSAIEATALELLELEGSELNLENMELLDVVQFAHLSGRTAVLHIRHQDAKGKIGFLDGDLVHAQYQETTGEDALVGLLALNQGDIFLQDGAVSSDITIERAWTELAQDIEDAILNLRATSKNEAGTDDEEITESDVSDLLALGEQAEPEEPAQAGVFFSDEELREIGDIGVGGDVGEVDLGDDPDIDPDIDIAVDESVSLEEGLAMISGSHGTAASLGDLARISSEMEAHDRDANLMESASNLSGGGIPQTLTRMPPPAPMLSPQVAASMTPKHNPGVEASEPMKPVQVSPMSISAPVPLVAAPTPALMMSTSLPSDAPILFTAENSLGETSAQLQDVLGQLCNEIPEFIATDIVHREDGLQVAGLTVVEDYNHVTAAAYYSDVLNASHEALLTFGLEEPPEEMLVTTDQAYILLRPLGIGPFMHMTIMHRSGNLGIARVVLRRYAPVLNQILPAL